MILSKELSKLKVNRDVREGLKGIAGKLPAILVVKTASYLWKGSDLLLTPVKADPETGGKIDPEKYYHITGPGFIELDHLVELEIAYKKGGLRAVDQYVNDLRDMDSDSFILNTPI